MSDQYPHNESERTLREMLQRSPDEVSVSHAEEVLDEYEEQRLSVARIRRAVYFLTHVIAIFLTIRFLLQALGANQDNPFVLFLNGVTYLFAAPFQGLFPPITSGRSTFDFGLIVGIAIYYIFAWIIVRLVSFYMTRPSAM